MQKNNKGFSIIEILIGIFIFTLGLISIYVLLNSSMKMSEYSKDTILASNLAREGIELARFKRDENFLGMYVWDYIDSGEKFSTGAYYKVSAGIDGGVEFDEIYNFTDDFSDSDIEEYRLYIDTEGNYVYDNSFTPTKYYRYIKFEDVTYEDETGNIIIVEDALKLKSNVYWYNKRPYEISINTIITDWKR